MVEHERERVVKMLIKLLETHTKKSNLWCESEYEQSGHGCEGIMERLPSLPV